MQYHRYQGMIMLKTCRVERYLTHETIGTRKCTQVHADRNKGIKHDSISPSLPYVMNSPSVGSLGCWEPSVNVSRRQRINVFPTTVLAMCSAAMCLCSFWLMAMQLLREVFIFPDPMQHTWCLTVRSLRVLTGVTSRLSGGHMVCLTASRQCVSSNGLVGPTWQHGSETYEVLSTARAMVENSSLCPLWCSQP
jgi:hypothetical protein